MFNQKNSDATLWVVDSKKNQCIVLILEIFINLLIRFWDMCYFICTNRSDCRSFSPHLCSPVTALPGYLIRPCVCVLVSGLGSSWLNCVFGIRNVAVE